MKNIAIIVPTLNKGGAERVAANMSLEFSKHYNVYTIVHDGRDIIYPYGGKLIDLALPPASSVPGKILTLLKRIRALRKIKKEYAIDVSISHLPPSNYVNIFSRRKEKVITYLHSMKGKPHQEKFFSMLSDKYICVSQYARQNAVENFGISEKKAVTVYNFCDIEPPTRTEQSDAVQIVNMGRLSREKGHPHLLRAMKLVIDKLGDRVHLTLIGDGNERQALEHLASCLGIQNQVTFAGFCQDPWSKLVNCDLYVLSSLWEGLPMALVEAGRCGLPIIAADCKSGCREILAPDTPVELQAEAIEYAKYGVLVPPFTEADTTQLSPTQEEKLLADAMIAFCQDPQLRALYAQKAKARAEDFYPNQIMAQWESIIDE